MALSKAKLDSRKKRLAKRLSPEFKIKDWREQKWKCPNCDYRFATKLDLKMHSYNHYGEKND